MPYVDPYHPASAPECEYEYVDCDNRVRGEHSPGQCATCGGSLLDVPVTRE